MLVLGAEQSDLVVCVCVCVYIYIYILFHYGLLQYILSILRFILSISLCYTVVPSCLSIQNIYNSWHLLISNSQSFPPPPAIKKNEIMPFSGIWMDLEIDIVHTLHSTAKMFKKKKKNLHCRPFNCRIMTTLRKSPFDWCLFSKLDFMLPKSLVMVPSRKPYM